MENWTIYFLFLVLIVLSIFGGVVFLIFYLADQRMSKQRKKREKAAMELEVKIVQQSNRGDEPKRS